MRSISRAVGCSINTVTKLLEDAGYAFADYHDKAVCGIRSRRIECDEIWSFCHARKMYITPKSPPTAGDVWTWIAMDTDSRMVLGYRVGKRGLRGSVRF